MPKSKNNFYVVWLGKVPGVYDSWEECQKQVHGFPGASFMGFKTRAMAETAFAGSREQYIGQQVHENTLTHEKLAEIGNPVMKSISVDASLDTSTGLMEFRGVDTKTKKEIFRSGTFFNATNNIGEFLAVVSALIYLKKIKSFIPVYTDSVTALAWVRNKKAKTNLEYAGSTRQLLSMVAEAEVWLRTNDYPNRVLKWETEAWGENPADFGRK